jgi:hypothetical protein
MGLMTGQDGTGWFLRSNVGIDSGDLQCFALEMSEFTVSAMA